MCRPITALSTALATLALVLILASSSAGAEVKKAEQALHGGLGVSINNSQQSVVVVGIVPGSPAERAGVQWGDEIFYVAEHRIRTTQDLTREVNSFKPGAQVELVVRRNGQRLVMPVTLGEYETIFARRANSYVPTAPVPADPQQQIRALQRQVYLLNQQLNQQQSLQDEVNEIQDWYSRGQRGQTGNDPALMQ
jgi:predicted metalloprotease with PDZ domain